MSKEEFKISLKATRINARLNLTEMSKKLGINKTTLISWEKGRTIPPYDKVRQICEITNTPIEMIDVSKK